MNIRWKLRMAAAQREVWTGSQLRRLLAEKAGLARPAGRSQTAQIPAGRRCRTRPQRGQGRLSAARAAFRWHAWQRSRSRNLTGAPHWAQGG